jgi:hypothetical protein
LEGKFSKVTLQREIEKLLMRMLTVIVTALCKLKAFGEVSDEYMGYVRIMNFS